MLMQAFVLLALVKSLEAQVTCGWAYLPGFDDDYDYAVVMPVHPSRDAISKCGGYRKDADGNVVANSGGALYCDGDAGNETLYVVKDCDTEKCDADAGCADAEAIQGLEFNCGTEACKTVDNQASYWKATTVAECGEVLHFTPVVVSGQTICVKNALTNKYYKYGECSSLKYDSKLGFIEVADLGLIAYDDAACTNTPTPAPTDPTPQPTPYPITPTVPTPKPTPYPVTPTTPYPTAKDCGTKITCFSDTPTPSPSAAASLSNVVNMALVLAISGLFALVHY